MRKAGEDGTLVCMHAENGIVIDELVKFALSERHVEPKFMRSPGRPAGGQGVHRALAIAEVARPRLYRASEQLRCAPGASLAPTRG